MADPKELSLRPYTGRLFYVKNRKAYLREHKKLFNKPDTIIGGTAARFTGGEGPDGLWTYLIYAETPHHLAHEVAHCVLHVFERCGIDPICGNGEPFCYLLSQILLDISLP